MARKQPDMSGLFTKTEEPKDPVKAFGVGLKISEWARIDAIAAELGETRHALVMWALKDFLRRWDAGEIRTQQKPTLPGI